MDFFDPLVAFLNGMTGLAFSIHGWISILLALIGVFALYIGLLWLMRRSYQGGHDQAVEDYRDPRRSDRDDR